jgi:hypothetical protein
VIFVDQKFIVKLATDLSDRVPLQRLQPRGSAFCSVALIWTVPYRPFTLLPLIAGLEEQEALLISHYIYIYLSSTLVSSEQLYHLQHG